GGFFIRAKKLLEKSIKEILQKDRSTKSSKENVKRKFEEAGIDEENDQEEEENKLEKEDKKEVEEKDDNKE
ncbi:hypothetical protein RYX36_010264, partial [Vicia faba]